MKPCSKNRARIALLAAGVVDARLERELRSHMEGCAGCRDYLDEMTCITEGLGAGPLSSNIEPSAAFHQILVSRLRAEQSAPTWEKAAGFFRQPSWNWRMALAAMSATVLVVVSLVIAFHLREVPSRVQSGAALNSAGRS